MQAQGQLGWTPPEDFSIRFDSLNSELFVGNVYVRHYLKNPGFPLRAPKAFLEGLLKTYLSDVANASTVNINKYPRQCITLSLKPTHILILYFFTLPPPPYPTTTTSLLV
jgi:hypothetical protein